MDRALIEEKLGLILLDVSNHSVPLSVKNLIRLFYHKSVPFARLNRQSLCHLT